MSANTPDQQITEPIGTDLADNPLAFVDMLADVEQRLVRQYTDVADRLARMLALTKNQVSSLATEDRLDVYNGSKHVSLRARSYNNNLMRTTDATAINNSVALVSDAVLTAPIVPVGATTYLIDFVVFYDCSTTADLKLTLTTPAVTNLRWVGQGLATTTSATAGDLKAPVITASGTTDSWGGAGVGTALAVVGTGYLTTSTAGNIVIQYAQQNLDATNLTVRAGSRLQVTVVS